MKKFIIILSLSIFYVVSAKYCQAQIININDETKEIESLKLKTGQLISHKEFSAINFKKGKLTTGEKQVVYNYIGAEVENAKNIVFADQDNYSNTEKLDNTHFRIYSSPKYFKDDNNIIHKIEMATTTPEIWQKASVPTLIDKITSILKTPYAMAGTSYAFNDDYIANYGITSYYDIRTALNGINFSNSIVAYNFVDTVLVPTWYNFRTPLEFNLSLIDPITIQSGTINLYTNNDTSDAVLQSYAFYKGTQANPPTLDDYNNFTTDQYTDIIADADIDNLSYNVWTLNTNGINYLKGGNDTFMFMEVLHDVGSSTPPNILDINFGRNFSNSSDSIDIRPYIELTVSGGGGSTTTPVVAIGDDIGIIYYNATTTKIDDNTTIIAGIYRIPYLIFKFITIIMAFCFAVLITFFLSFINKKKKL